MNTIFLLKLIALLKISFAKFIRLLFFFKKSRHACRVITDVIPCSRKKGAPFEILITVPEETFSHPLPGNVEEIVHWKFTRMHQLRLPPLSVLKLTNASIVGKHAYTLTEEGALVYEASPVFALSPRLHPVFALPFLPASEKIAGGTAVFSQAGEDNFFHWLFDVLPKFKLLEWAGAIPDHFLISSEKRFQKESLSLLGLHPELIISLKDGELYQCEKAIIFTQALIFSRWRCLFLRELFSKWMADDIEPGFRLYVTRKNELRRRITNEVEVESLLAGYGFVVVNPATLSLREQINIFSQAECVVASHGGALANIVFASDGCKLIELFSPGYVNCCFWGIASIIGVTYFYLLGKGRRYGDWDPHLVYADILIEIAQLRKLLHKAGIERII